MSLVKNKNTAPEKKVRSLLHKMGYRFRLNVNNLPGEPDVVLPKHKKIIFVNGCFWHGHDGCKKSKRPTSNTDFWNSKIDKNKKRDLLVRRLLKSQGWKVLVLWQCQIRDAKILSNNLQKFLHST